MTNDLRIPKKQITFTGKLLDYKEFLQYGETFIETGTAAGDGVQRALDAGFKPVISIEAAKHWFDMSAKRFGLEGPDVFLYEGKSTDTLGGVLHYHLNKNEIAIIFLDAHPSGELSAGHADWVANPNGEANQHNIITAELEIVLIHGTKHVIIIDDINGMDDGCAEQYMNQLLLANPDYKFFFYDENLSGDLLYKDKILVAIS